MGNPWYWIILVAFIASYIYNRRLKRRGKIQDKMLRQILEGALESALHNVTDLLDTDQAYDVGSTIPIDLEKNVAHILLR